MKIAITGASGKTGYRISEENKSRSVWQAGTTSHRYPYNRHME